MYEPEVDDYVIWNQGEYGKHQGWVYFKGEPVDNDKRVKYGWNPVPRYITLEIGTKPKPRCDIAKDRNHKLIHTLLLCYDTEWKNLTFVKKRKSKNDDTIILWAKDVEHGETNDIGRREFYSKNKEQFMLDMYKSQDGRYLDTQ